MTLSSEGPQDGKNKFLKNRLKRFLTPIAEGMIKEAITQIIEETMGKEIDNQVKQRISESIETIDIDAKLTEELSDQVEKTETSVTQAESRIE